VQKQFENAPAAFYRTAAEAVQKEKSQKKKTPAARACTSAEHFFFY
jgi:hypothetical protein